MQIWTRKFLCFSIYFDALNHEVSINDTYLNTHLNNILKTLHYQHKQAIIKLI